MRRLNQHLHSVHDAMLALSVATVVSVSSAEPTSQTFTLDPFRVEPSESILSEYTPQAPPSPKPPKYTLLRFNEDYSYLADPKNRTDFFDPLKYIALDAANPKSYLSFGGEIRERYEHRTNPRFGVPGQPHDDDYLLQRVALHFDLHINEHFRVFVQGISGIQFGGEREKSAINQDAIDLQQAFVDFRVDQNGGSERAYLIVRTGRFAMTYGSSRLVATRAAPNIPFKFDGVQIIGAAAGAKIYAFITKPAREREHSFDDEFPGQLFWGIYATTPSLGTPLNLKLDLYYLGYKEDDARFANATGDEERHTIGTRLFGKCEGFDYDVEPIFQFGRIGDNNILAWTVGSSFGYTFEGAPWTPRIGLLLDIASGDTNRNGGGAFGTFNPLFFKPGYFNDASLIRPSNIIDVHPTLQLRPCDNVLLTFGSDVLWRYTTEDGVYGPGKNQELPAGSGSRYLATTVEVAAQWQINRHTTWLASYVHVFAGDYIRNASGDDVDFFGTWLTFTW